VLPRVVSLISERAAEALFAKLATVVSAEPVMLVRVSDARSFRIPRGSVDSLWDNVQAGVFTSLPPLRAVVLGRPYWYSSAEDFFRDVLVENADATIWSVAQEGHEEFMLLQFGGGVEDLRLQVLLESSGRATVWLFDARVEYSWLPDPVIKKVDGDTTARAFRLARSQGLPKRSRAVWVCGALDGGVDSFTMAGEEGIGRVVYLNSQEPPEELRMMSAEVLEALGIIRNGPWFAWRDG
jgi:hypothetical protein